MQREKRALWQGGWIRRLILIAAIGTLVGVEVIDSVPASPQALIQRAQATSDQFGVRISYGDPSSFEPARALPPETRSRLTMTEADRRYLEPALEGIHSALTTYPAGFVAARVRDILVCGTLRLPEGLIAGTYGPESIFVAAGANTARATFIARIIHHEFSSFVWNQDPSLHMTWGFLLPGDWKPSPSVREMLSQPDAGDELLAEGFLTPYGATSAENDFNTYAEAVFLEPERLVRLAEDRRVVRQKAAALIRSYVGLDPRMQEVFQELGVAQLYEPGLLRFTIDVPPPIYVPEGRSTQ